MQLIDYFRAMAAHQASDLFFSAGAPVGMKVEGLTRYIDDHPLDAATIEHLARSAMSDAQQQGFEEQLEVSLSVPVDGLGRFRCTMYYQRNTVAMVVRHVRNHIPSLDRLGLPALLRDLVLAPRGLILIVGATGSGKSTTLASMIDHRNRQRSGHVLTVEDPIEYLHPHRRSIVDQRELGLDAHSYATALSNAMRAAPDVIMIGEIRDRETMRQAVAYSETGHLCLSTMHASNAYQTIDRIINFFPDSAHRQLRIDLALNLRAVVSQRLVVGQDGLRLPATEVLLSTPYVRDLIEKGEIASLRAAMEDDNQAGMHSFDQDLFKLYEAGRISRGEALAHANSRGDLHLRIDTESTRNDSSQPASTTDRV